MTAERGVITSPRVMEAAQISRCIWSVTTSPKRRFKLTFLHYNVKLIVNGSFSCSESHVTVLDGTELTPSNILGRFCFPTSKKVIYTGGNKMVLVMVLPKRHYLDFVAVYESVGLHEGKHLAELRLFVPTLVQLKPCGFFSVIFYFCFINF